ncbi:MAG: Single-stranded nucleic acid binding R3H domain protein [Candidatus Woesebacteria bacterium GW2011_GWB1_43_14]|uniref:Single-stranded nucleic acid binding R3H domain protein n=1 Tax=Candidatus Woesebacteria bacterium GW2011_GWB1_43_14 TaxID=1618578 RepID=A0A0G1FVH6_9BACT|nr:MAG: Single-stranded nucleic acid binding R3H domain protein [Candidatus Woesebacteria bacterium GW2011_GWA1_39_11b]KKS78264.1 MAG: single-stranded nucleic acid binding R3H domain-containing protein, spoIIIJ-associated protein [Candidatus Woesebacteria bacterium GW2011_GWC1_42_9]KKS99001.1 MAG: Single-stranded nucleic acid binding R3H domain protein [Candidatus Woesebacteria bacterium GW2011_GWB1_43_14]
MAKQKSDPTKKIVEALSSELFSLLSIDTEINVSVDETLEEKVYNVNVSGKEQAGLLIGAHGATLSAIQSFLSLAVRQKTEEWVRIVVDVDGWREKHEDYLKELAIQAGERARSTGEPQNLYNLTPAQRRVIHVALSKEKGIVTESKGEGEGRYLVVSPK